jgi:hypothetical protein
MVRYLSKFVLEVMPSVVATVIGAYIVVHYINPTKTEAPKAAAASTETAGAQAAGAPDATEVKAPEDAKADDVKAADAKAADARPVDAKSVDAKAADAKPAASDQARPVRQIAITKPAPPAEVKPVEAKKDANELARAAIERLRGSVDTAATASVASQPAGAPVETVSPQPPQDAASQEPARPEPMSREPVRVAVPLPVIRAPVVTVGSTVVAPPPLPPPVIVATPYGRHSVGPGPAMPVTQPDPTADSAMANPPIPPADIPMPHSFELPPPAAPVENVADHMLSTTKAFFRALTPH